ncbi:hypothetical protein [Polymorphobacter sp.]|uniref:hypothetical protein n=1 Tax=Polymorphobacter sp. TaxID=1909290 RepID=UPI003F717DFF
MTDFAFWNSLLVLRDRRSLLSRRDGADRNIKGLSPVRPITGSLLDAIKNTNRWPALLLEGIDVISFRN